MLDPDSTPGKFCQHFHHRGMMVVAELLFLMNRPFAWWANERKNHASPICPYSLYLNLVFVREHVFYLQFFERIAIFEKLGINLTELVNGCFGNRM